MAVDRDRLRVDYTPPTIEEGGDFGLFTVRPHDASMPVVTVTIGEREISAGLVSDEVADEAVSVDIRSAGELTADRTRQESVVRTIAATLMEVLDLQSPVS